MEFKDYDATLGVARTAPPDDLAQRRHP